ncbi:SDR family oxidoreductase [Tundrisphaera lichenicola]|uniref:SDR family oxidoreductase n=1 Tax=Tundrisphaera lichenicola TaxID=2029860 RepID=UPI003EBA69FE
MPVDDKPILITGASGYIGGRLVPQLLAKGYRIRCLARDVRKLSGRAWDADPRVEIVRGDVLDRASVRSAMEGCQAAYYLVHSMLAGEKTFEKQDRVAAENFATAAEEAGVGRIIYLGGLGHRSEKLSPHLESRHEVGDVLRSGKVPVTELRAAMIVGSGSASFEMLRALVHKLPVMLCPRWVETRTQPIAIRDVLAYLVGVLETPETAGGTFDIGGPDILTYRQMMTRFAEILGYRRWIITVPVLTPRLSAYWVNLMTPVNAGLAFALIESLAFETVCEEGKIQELVPIPRTGFDDACRWALDKVNQNAVETRWTNASLPHRVDHITLPVLELEQYAIRDVQRFTAEVPALALFDKVRRIGGDVGWYYAEFLWEIRGWMDRAIGGVGVRRGRRDPVSVRIGDAIDFWRVEDVVPGRRLLLHAEMIVPGDAWLEFRVEPDGEDRSELIQTAYFRPSPFWGKLYWYACFPLHWFVFSGMARNIVRAAERDAEPRPVPAPLGPG